MPSSASPADLLDEIERSLRIDGLRAVSPILAAARAAAVSPSTLRRAAARGEIRLLKSGPGSTSRVLIGRRDLARYLASRPAIPGGAA